MAASDEKLRPVSKFIAALSYGSRFVRQLLSTAEGYLVAGHAHGSSVAYTADLRDADLDTGDEIDMREYEGHLLTYSNTLDESVTIITYGRSVTGGTNHLLSTDVLADGSATEQTAIHSLTDPWPFIIITAQAGGVPTAGTASVRLNKRT